MADKFDRYREALIVETSTIWQPEHAPHDPAQRARLEQALHADPAACAGLEYVRVHTGFCRQITVTAEDLERLRGAG
jgi:hypothetical protein